MKIPNMTPVKVPSMPKPVTMAKPPEMPVFDRAVEMSGEERPRSVFRPAKMENQPPAHWSGKSGS